MIDECRYILLDCQCAVMSYLNQSLSVLQVPFEVIAQDKLTKLTHTNNTRMIMACCNHQKDIVLGNATQFPTLICHNEDDHIIADEPLLTTLKVPFTIYQLKHALLTVESADHNELNHADNKLFDNLIGESPAIKQIKLMIRQVANSDSNILILGQSGTGKEVIATCIHQFSNRSSQPFVPINCGAIPSELMESELFGHEKGAFTGAVSKRPGRFELANHGTLFLDEIGDMPLSMQVKLLRVIQDHKIERVGSTANIDVDVRIIAATNKNLEDMIDQHTFREDLFYRLNVIPIYVPTLHERISDIPLLIEYQLEKIRKRIPHHAIFSPDAIHTMCNYTWPGNIRELANFIERMVVLNQDKVIDEHDVTQQLDKMKVKQQLFTIPHDQDTFNMKEYLSTLEQQIINSALKKSNGIISTAADYLHLGRTTLIEKMKKYNLTASPQS